MNGTRPLVAAALFAGLHASADAPAATPDGALGAVYRAPADGGPRRWQVTGDRALDVRERPSVDAPLVERVDGGTVLANLGCDLVDGPVWCRVGTLRGKVRGHAPAERLAPAIGPDGTVPTGTDDSVRRARRGDVDARDTIPCAQERGEVPGECAAGVARGGGGDAAVVVTFPNGFGRTLHFVHGELVSANATMSGSGTDTDWRLEDGVHVIRVDDQRYEIDDDFVIGR